MNLDVICGKRKKLLSAVINIELLILSGMVTHTQKYKRKNSCWNIRNNYSKQKFKKGLIEIASGLVV